MGFLSHTGFWSAFSSFSREISIDFRLNLALFRGAVFRHGAAALKQPIKHPNETLLTIHLGLNGHFPSLNGPFAKLHGAFH